MASTESPFPWLQSIYFGTMRLIFRAERDCTISHYIGAEIRGSIGEHLKTYVNCGDARDANCDQCPSCRRTACLYNRFFNHGGNHPKPLILRLDPPRVPGKISFSKSEHLLFDLRFIGAAMEDAGHVQNALSHYPLKLGQQGFRFHLEDAIWTGTRETLPLGENVFYDSAPSPSISLLELTCATPCEVRQTHKKYIRAPHDLSFNTLVFRIKERSAQLSKHHCEKNVGAGEQTPPIPQIYMQSLSQIQMLSHQGKWQFANFRNKPAGHIKGGLVGTFIFKGPISAFEDLLIAATHLGLGKDCTNGFGQINMRVFEPKNQ